MIFTSLHLVFIYILHSVPTFLEVFWKQGVLMHQFKPFSLFTDHQSDLEHFPIFLYALESNRLFLLLRL